MILLRDFLRTHMLLDGHRIVGAAFDSRVVTHDETVDATHTANTRDHTSTRRIAVVHGECRQRAEL